MEEHLQNNIEFTQLQQQRKSKKKKPILFRIALVSFILIAIFIIVAILYLNKNEMKINLFSKNKKRILVIGSIGYDMITFMDKFPKEGETIPGIKFKENPGGKGNNQCISAARAGATVSFLGAIGDDHYGEVVKKVQEDNNVDVHLKKCENESTQIATILVDTNGANRIIISQGANLKVDKKQIDENIDLIKKSDIIIFQFEINIETVEYAINICHDLGKIIILNPAPGYKISNNILKKVTYLTPNESELGIISQMPYKTIDEIKKAGISLINKGLKNIIITIGDRGALLLNKNEEKLFNSYKVDAIDTTGAGDCFNGVFAAYLTKGKDVYTAIKYANIASSISVSRVGAVPSFPYENEIEEKFKKYNN